MNKEINKIHRIFLFITMIVLSLRIVSAILLNKPNLILTFPEIFLIPELIILIGIWKYHKLKKYQISLILGSIFTLLIIPDVLACIWGDSYLWHKIVSLLILYPVYIYICYYIFILYPWRQIKKINKSI